MSFWLATIRRDGFAYKQVWTWRRGGRGAVRRACGLLAVAAISKVALDLLAALLVALAPVGHVGLRSLMDFRARVLAEFEAFQLR
jgi:hypothetical protein